MNGYSDTSIVKDYSLSERVYQFVIDNLLSGELKPGEKITEASIAIELSISRGPIREAFKRLAEDHILTLIPRSGCFVSELDAEDVRNIFEIRKRLESYSFQIAFDRVSIGELKSMKSAFEDCYKSLNKGSVEKFLELDEAFHSKFIELSNSIDLQAILKKLYLKVNIYRFIGKSYFERLKPALEEHLAILGSMIEGDLSGALGHLERHIDNSRKHFLKHEFNITNGDQNKSSRIKEIQLKKLDLSKERSEKTMTEVVESS